MKVIRMTTALALILPVFLMASVSIGAGAAATKGSFATFADGPSMGYDIDGKARMVRTADGKTMVTVNVSGLVPGAVYGSHVHNQACWDGNAGGHYRFDAPVPGGDLDGHEIWPGPFTANPAGHAQGKATVMATAGADAVSVVIHAPTGQKIACADLS